MASVMKPAKPEAGARAVPAAVRQRAVARRARRVRLPARDARRARPARSLTYVNPAFEGFFGYRAGEAVGRPLGQAAVPATTRRWCTACSRSQLALEDGAWERAARCDRWKSRSARCTAPTAAHPLGGRVRRPQRNREAARRARGPEVPRRRALVVALPCFCAQSSLDRSDCQRSTSIITSAEPRDDAELDVLQLADHRRHVGRSGTPPRHDPGKTLIDHPLLLVLAAEAPYQPARRAQQPRVAVPRGRPAARRAAGRLPPRISGRLSAGMPHSVHSVQNDGSPVESRPLGASPAAAGVMIASQRSNIWSKPR